jgi:hypothetical protein
MNLVVDESKAILFKAVSLVEKTIDKLRRVDTLQFPTSSSEDARDLLLAVFEAIREPISLDSVAPAVLYRRLFSLQALVDSVCRSSTDCISWPLVSYCDDVWKRLFNANPSQLFYSLTAAHNYTIYRFSEQVASCLNGVLARAQVDELIKGRKIYCLELPSSEDANLPLYANIGHEFGHAVFDHHQTEILQILAGKRKAFFDAVLEELKEQDAGQVPQRFRSVPTIFKKSGEEVFCDLIAARLMGPAFLLSLAEMSWGDDNKSTWTVSVSTDDKFTRTHPSFSFRVDLIEQWVKFNAFCSAIPKDYAACILKPSSVENSADVVRGRLHSDNGNVFGAISEAIEKHLDDLKQALREFITECSTNVNRWCPEDVSAPESTAVTKLLERLENKILPNIEPDSSLLGRCASFPAILIASALYRLRLLAEGNVEPISVSRQTDTVERLTAKAMEVTYVQRDYAKWLRGDST